jgi:hypothetical protein
MWKCSWDKSRGGCTMFSSTRDSLFGFTDGRARARSDRAAGQR